MASWLAVVAACGSNGDTDSSGGDGGAEHEAGADGTAADGAANHDSASSAPDSASRDGSAAYDAGEDAALSDAPATDATDGDDAGVDGASDASRLGDASDASGTDANEADAGATDGAAMDGGSVDAGFGDTGAVDAGSTDAGGADSGVPACTNEGFAAQPAAWTLPSGGPDGVPETSFSLTTGCGSSDEYEWSTFDIDGDGLPDLVVTGHCFDTTVGHTQWSVYKNTGSRFAAQPAAWSLPAVGTDGFPEASFALTTGCGSSDEYEWSTFDIDGDARPDLVVTGHCFDTTIGHTQWSVYKNTGSGFASQATAWALPSVGTDGFPEASFALTTTGCGSSDEYQWSTFDIGGDGKPDLVVTDHCFDAVVGQTAWSVFTNAGAGFAAQATSWPLPTGYGGFPQKDFVLTSGCGSSDEYQWSTVDLNVDGKPDLVVTGHCFDTTIGQTQWNVHLNGGAGFAAQPTAWSLPSGWPGGFPSKDFAVTSGCGSSDEYSWKTLDIDGDQKLDLVVTGLCFDPAIGQTVWYPYLGTASGFAATPSCFPLPTIYATGFPVADFALTSGCGSSDEYQWSTLDMNGDKKPDLAVTGHCFDTTIGQTQWNVHANER